MNKKIWIDISIVFIVVLLVIIKLTVLPCKNNKTNNKSNNSNKQINENQQSINKTEKDILLDSFYDKSITTNYKDIRELDEYYNKDEAKKDHCFVVGAMVYNEDLYTEFMNNYKNKKDVFIRVVQNTVEGDAIIYDLKYDSKQDKIFLVIDNTRDKYSADEDRKITIKEFEKTSEYEINNHLYWVVYNGELNDETFESENVFEVVLIN